MAIYKTTGHRQAGKIPEWREEDFRTIVTRNADAMIVLNREGCVLYVNPAAESIYDLSSTEMVGAMFGFPIILDKPVELYILRKFKDFVAAEMRMVEVLWAGEPSYLLSFRDLTDRIMAEQALSHARDDLDAMVNERTRELSEANKRLELEITERKQAEEKLRENHRFTTTLMGNLPGMAYRRRNVKDWTMEFLSSGCSKLTGYKIENLFLNKTISYGQLIHPDDRDRVWDETQVSLQANKPYALTYRLITAGQEEKWVVDQGRYIIKNNQILLEGFITDITERKKAETELNEARLLAELYVDLMGHDINNMNHSAMGYLELALETLEADKKLGLDNKDLIERPLKALISSTTLIGNVRKLQRLMSEGVKPMPVDLSEILNNLDVRSFQAEGRDITINVQMPPHCQVGANELLKDVIHNLVSNAIKHSDEQKPLTIDLKVEPVTDNGTSFYRCTVEDNGRGIPDEMKKKLFHRFQRGATKAQGKGLGLYLVRTLVEGYHGKVWVEDRVPGDHTKGARFVVMLPAIEPDT